MAENTSYVTTHDTTEYSDTARILSRLVVLCKKSEKGFFSAAEHIQNRGVKVLLKVYAQRRDLFAAELSTKAPIDHYLVPKGEHALAGLQRGLLDIQAAMTLGRKHRQHVLLSMQLDEEQRVLTSYEEALNAGLPADIAATVERQRDEIQITYNRLMYLNHIGHENLVVRLFNQEDEALIAIEQLRRRGFEPEDISLTKIDSVPRYVADRDERRASKAETAAAGAVAGAFVGGIIGVIIMLFQLWMPSVGISITVGPLAMIVSSLTSGAVIGVVFGLLIGQGEAEEDAYLYRESLRDGDTLVAVYAGPNRVAEAENQLKLHHEREL